MLRRAFICGISSDALSDDETRFIARHRPLGIILFSRNIRDREQVFSLITSLREAVNGSPLLVLVDQEGGRVQRFGPPHWPRYPGAARFCEACPVDTEAASRAAFLSAQAMARDLFELGVNVACAPVLDVPVPDADAIIGDRAYATDPDTVAILARAVADGLLAGGVLPVVKHIPGHGRATSDSHLALPLVDAPLAELERTDFVPFAKLADLPIAMTAHITYSAIDPTAPATLSGTVVLQVIRDLIGFNGLLLTDDLSMHALSGTIRSRAEAAFLAGCDVALHCNGDMVEMIEVAAGSPPLDGVAEARFHVALACLKPPLEFNREAADEAIALALAVTA